MRHRIVRKHFNRDRNSRRALFLNLSKSLIEKEQIKTTLERAKVLRSVVEKLITRAKVDSVANRRLIASELENDSAAIKKLFVVLGPRYKDRAGGYTRVLKMGIRYGDAASMGVIEFIDREVTAKKPALDKKDQKTAKESKVSEDKKETVSKKKAPSIKVAKEAESNVKAVKSVKKEVSVKRRTTGK